MNKFLILFATIFCALPLLSQPKKGMDDGNVEHTFPTKYATTLYASQVTDTSGNNKLLAAHFQNKGGGIFTWQKDMTDAGNYAIAVSYATHFAGTKATIFTTKSNAISAVLEETSGIILAGKTGTNLIANANCYQVNYNSPGVQIQLRFS